MASAVNLSTARRVDEESDGDRVWRRLERLGRDTQDRLVSMHAGFVPDAAELARSLAPLSDLVERGVDVRVVCSRAYAHAPHIRAAVTGLLGRGVVVRFADHLPYRFLIADGSSVATPLRGSRLAEGAAFTSDPAVLQGLETLAEQIFRRSVPLPDVPLDGSRIGPTRLERRVVRLLCTGVTDDVAARHLGVTDRQYRRYVAGVMGRLEAGSRFQAGVLAAERGWI